MRSFLVPSILLAAGLAFASPGMAQPATPATSAPAAAAAPAAPAATAAKVADPTLDAAGKPLHTAQPGVGEPVDKAFYLQQQVTPTGQEAHWFHNYILVPLITIISVVVLLLLLWVIVRYRRAANPTPSRTRHNTVIEIIWTLAPG